MADVTYWGFATGPMCGECARRDHGPDPAADPDVIVIPFPDQWRDMEAVDPGQPVVCWGCGRVLLPAG